MYNINKEFLFTDSNNSVELPSLVKTSSRSTGFTLADSKRNKDDPRITNNVEDVFMSTTSKRKRTFKSGNDAFKLPGDSSHLHPHFAHGNYNHIMYILNILDDHYYIQSCAL